MSKRLPNRRRSQSIFILLIAGLLLNGGCASIRLHQSMENLHNVHYLDLFQRCENQDLLGIRDAARSLRQALDDPAIAGYSSDDEYQQLLGRARKAAEEIVRQSDSFQLNDNASRLRREVYLSCQACHRSYRV